MAEVNPFEIQPQNPIQAWGGMPQITPQTGEVPPPGQFGGLPPGEGGSYFALSPEAMQMMWAPQAPRPQPQQIQAPPLPPPQPLV